MEAPENVLLGEGPRAFHLPPTDVAGGHSKREILFQTQGTCNSKKEYFSVDQPCLRDANSELVRTRNLEVGCIHGNLLTFPPGQRNWHCLARIFY